ncbi:MAG: hypothetical protein ACJAW3_000584 [Lentimonas sp.]|jgi:hypothetical protein
MIRNILYSLFLHFILIFITYLSFNFNPPIEIDKGSKVSVSFVVKAGNSNKSSTQQSKPTIISEKKEIKKELKRKKEIKKSKKKSQIKPKEKPKPKPKPKKIEKAKKTPQKPKAKKPEIKKPEIKKEKPKEIEKVKEEIEKEEKPEPEIVEETVKENVKSDEIDQELFSQNTIENLQLLVREKFNIQNQIKHCYKIAMQQSNLHSKEEINVKIFISEDGTIEIDRLVFKDFHKYEIPEEKNYIESVNLVKETLKFCSPMRNLPEDKYDVWKEIDLKFNSQ